MKGFIRTAAASLCLSAGALTIAGCTQYRAHVDPCWPERYNAETRKYIRDTFDAQSANGHALDQTIWNYYFETDEKGNPTDKLTPGGQERLRYLMRRRPVPDGRLYLQTANDLPATVDINQLPQQRQEIDTQRIAAVQRYLTAVMAGRSTPVNWEVAVIDPAAVGLPASVLGGSTANATAVTGAYPQHLTTFQGAFGVVPGFTIPIGGGGAGGGPVVGGGGAIGGAGQQGQQGQGQQGAGGGQQGPGGIPQN